MKRPYIQTDPLLLFCVPTLLLLVPFPWFCAVMIAALVHESAHLICVTALGGRVQKISFEIPGAVISAFAPDHLAHCISIAAGPVFSLSLTLWRNIYPELAFCGLVQGLYNMLPVLPLDGGRLAVLFLDRYIPEKAGLLMEIICHICQILILGIIIFTAIQQHWQYFPVELLLLFSLMRKSPCKDAGIKVQ